MSGPIPIRIGLPGGIRALRVEQTETKVYGRFPRTNWCIWLNANADFTLGTFIKLGYDGSINRVTIHPDGTESVFNLVGE